ncbi:ABC transporter permease [Phytoactinopolyspora halophila]
MKSSPAGRSGAAAPAPDPASAAPGQTATTDPLGAAPALAGRRRSEMLYFALRNPKVILGLSVIVAFLLFGLLGPLFSEFGPRERNAGPLGAAPSSDFWLGTTWTGQDVFTQLAHGTRATFQVALMAAAISAFIGMTMGFVAGYRGGRLDEILMMITNIVLVLPVFVVVIVVTAYLGISNTATQALVIGLFNWTWVARAVRAQTLSLRARDFVDLARLSGVRTLSIIRREIAPNMASYLVMTFILLFAGAIVFAATLDFLNLGPRGGMSLGLMLQQANQQAAMSLGLWWWFVFPGAAITAITGSAYLTNVGLDEVFNPKLREM